MTHICNNIIMRHGIHCMWRGLDLVFMQESMHVVYLFLSLFQCRQFFHLQIKITCSVYIYSRYQSIYKTIQRIQINATSNSIKHAWSLSLYIHDAQCEGKELKGHYIAFSACMFIPCFGSIMPDCVMMASNSQHCIFFFITQQEQPRSQAEFSLL